VLARTKRIPRWQQTRNLLKAEREAALKKNRPRLIRDFPPPLYGTKNTFAGAYDEPVDPRTLRMPSFFMRMIRPPGTWPANRHIFHVPMVMNKVMVRNYLEQLYGIHILKVEIAIIPGRPYVNVFMRYPVRRRTPDIKRAIVITKETFKFPNWLEVRELEKEAAAAATAAAANAGGNAGTAANAAAAQAQ
jgi:ribosomal protein L23